jgi:hypothetical protein
MTLEERKDRLRRAFQGLNSGNAGEWLGLFADDLVWRATPSEVFPPLLRGKHEVITKLFGALTAKLAGPPRIHVDELIGEGDRIVALAHGEAKTKRGEAYDQSYCFIFRFRDEQVVEVDERFDSALVNRVLA